jgi:PST family polysaccharide transporter
VIIKSCRKNDNDYFWLVIFSKLPLLLLAAVLIIIIVVFSATFYNHYQVIVLSFSVILGIAFLPNWFFQGLEKMEINAWLNVLARTIYIALVFVFIRSTEDYVYVYFFFGIGILISSFAGIIIAVRRYGIGFKAPPFQKILKMIKSDFRLTISNLIHQASTGSGTIIISLFAPLSVVGSFGIAEKLYIAFRHTAVIAFHSTFPKASELYLNSKADLKKLYLSYFKLSSVLIIPVIFLLIIFSKGIFYLMAGHVTSQSINTLQLLFAATFFAVLNVPFAQLLILGKFEREYLYSTILGTIFLIITGAVASAWFSQEGMAFAILMSELLILLLLMLFSKKARIF